MLVTELERPRMAGRVVVERLRDGTARHKSAVLFTFPGTPDDSVVRDSISHDAIHFFQKPFSMESARPQVREALSE
jgi:hypothetical protein